VNEVFLREDKTLLFHHARELRQKFLLGNGAVSGPGERLLKKRRHGQFGKRAERPRARSIVSLAEAQRLQERQMREHGRPRAIRLFAEAREKTALLFLEKALANVRCALALLHGRQPGGKAGAQVFLMGGSLAVVFGGQVIEVALYLRQLLILGLDRCFDFVLPALDRLLDSAFGRGFDMPADKVAKGGRFRDL